MLFHHCVSINCIVVYFDIYQLTLVQLCSITLVTGLFICLRSAAKITHKAQSVTSLAAKWHICSTTNSFDDFDAETPRSPITSDQAIYTDSDAYCDTDNEEGDGDDEIDNTNMVPVIHAVSYQKRQALGELQ